MENKPEGKRPIEEALSEIGSAFSLFHKLNLMLVLQESPLKRCFYSCRWHGGSLPV